MANSARNKKKKKTRYLQLRKFSLDVFLTDVFCFSFRFCSCKNAFCYWISFSFRFRFQALSVATPTSLA